MASPEYRALDTEAQADEISDIMTRARKAAKANVLTGEPILDQRPVKGERKRRPAGLRSEEHTSELQYLMRNSYAVFYLNKKKTLTNNMNKIHDLQHTTV